MVRYGRKHPHERGYPTSAWTPCRNPGLRHRAYPGSCRPSRLAETDGTRCNGRDQHSRQDYPRRCECCWLAGRQRFLIRIVATVDSESVQHAEKNSSLTPATSRGSDPQHDLADEVAINRRTPATSKRKRGKVESI